MILSSEICYVIAFKYSIEVSTRKLINFKLKLTFFILTKEHNISVRFLKFTTMKLCLKCYQCYFI